MAKARSTRNRSQSLRESVEAAMPAEREDETEPAEAPRGPTHPDAGPPTTGQASGRNPASKRAKKRALREAKERDEEQQLEALLFGKTKPPRTQPEAFNYPGSGDDGSDAGDAAALFEIDRDGDGPDRDADDTGSLEGGRNNRRIDINPDSEARAWVDHDDEDGSGAAVRVDLLATSRLRKLRTSRDEAGAQALPVAEFEERLRRRYQETQSLQARTDWANISKAPTKKRKETAHGDSEDDPTETDNFLSTSAPLLQSSSSRCSGRPLPPNILNIVRCRDANEADPSRSVVQSVQFHPTSPRDRPLLLTAGLDKALRFFQVGADSSEKVHGIQFPKLPIYSAAFLGSTGNVVVSGRRSFFYIYDAVAGSVDLVPRIVGRAERSLEKFCASPDGSLLAFLGNDGYVVLVDVRTRQWVADLKLNGSVRALTFGPGGGALYASGSDGQVYVWDVVTRRCVERFDNGDGTITSSLACSAQHLAVGAESGVVNLYPSGGSGDGSGGGDGGTRPLLKSIMNLHTSSDLVRFNADGQVLALSSRREKQALKLVHVPTQTVFSNWPTSKTPLGYVWSMDFSPQSQFLAVGNDKGKCLLYRLSHFSDMD